MSVYSYITRAFIPAFITWLLPYLSVAQDSSRPLSLSQAVSAALSNNRNMHLAGLDEQIAAAGYRQTEAVFLPEINFSYTAITTNNPLNAFGFKLQQQIITQNDFDPARLNHPAATADITTKLEIKQPLLNMDMLYQRKGAQKQTEIYQYKTLRTREYLAFEVQKAYMQLQLAFDAVKVLEEALQRVEAVYAYSNNRYKEGLMQQSDVLNVQVQVTTVQSNLSHAQSAVRNASDYLSLLMGSKPGIVYVATDAFTEDSLLRDTSTAVAADRADFMAMQKAIEAADIMITASRMSYLPKLNAFGSYQYNDSRVAGFGANAYLAGVQLSWDIFKGNHTRHAIATRQLERDKLSETLRLEKEKSQLELNKAWRDLSDASFDIRQQTAAAAQAAEAFRILQNRYQQGLVSTTDVLMAQNQLAQQQFQLVQARYSRNVSRFYILFLIASSQP